MTIDIYVRQQPDGTYRAHVLVWPEMVVTAPTRDAAIVALQTAIQHEVDQGHLAQISLTEPNPFLLAAGSWANDPTYDDLMEHIAAYRRELDAQEAQAVA